MLIIGPPGEVEYYLGRLASDQDGEGTWTGRGAAHLGLTGTPTSGQLRQMLHGLDPVTGRPRWASAPRRRRLGHDVVLSAPKPISIIGALGRPDVSEAVVAAHDAAVADAFGYLDRQAAWARRGSEGRLVPTAGLVAAAFRHRTSRARDPHLHTHVLVANAVQDQEGAWSSLDGRWLFAEARAAGALYQSALRYYTAKAGLSLTWRMRDGGLGDVVDVPAETVREFSRRRRQIEAHLAGWSGPTWPARPSRRTGRIAQLVTRPPKPGREDATPAGPDAWSVRARRTGFDPGSITVRGPEPLSTAEPPPGRTLLAAAAISDVLGPEGVTARSSLFTRRDLVRSVAAHLTVGAPAAVVEAEVERLLASPAVVRVTPETAGMVRPRSTARYTTPELAALDERVLAQVATPARPPVAGAGDLRSTLASRPGLSPSQVSAVMEIVTSKSAVTVLRAQPGLARNAVIEAARAAWETSGTAVAGLTPTPRDAIALEAVTGIEAIVIGAAEPDGRGLAAAAVIVVDGADRLSSRVLADLIDRSRWRGQRLVLVDLGRRPAVLEGRELLSRLHRAVGGPAPLVEEVADEPNRSRSPNRVARVVRSGGTVTFTADPDSQRQAMVDDWCRRSAGTGPMVAATRSEVDDLNRRARRQLIAEARIRGPSVKAGGREYRAGEPVVVRRSAPALKLVAGQLGTVSAVDPQRRTVTIDFAGRRRPVALAARKVGPTVLAHAYALPPRRAFPDAVDTFVLGASGRGPPTGRTHVYLVASGCPERSRLSGDRLTRLAHQGASDTRVLPPSVDADLGQVESARSALAGELQAGMPPDVAGALIGAREELVAAAHWTSGPAASSTARWRRDAAERAVAQLEHEAVAFDAWTERRRPDLDRLAGLDRTIDHRRHLLGRAAEVLPDPGLTAAIGPPGLDPTWRDHAAAFEAYRERWGIDPRTVEPVPRDPLQQRQRDDLLRVIARVQDPISRDREHRREVGIGLR